MPVRKPVASYEETRAKSRERRGLSSQPQTSEAALPLQSYEKPSAFATVKSKQPPKPKSEKPKPTASLTPSPKKALESAPVAPSEKRTISFVLPYPKEGVSQEYDAIAEAYDRKKALSTIATRALKHFEDPTGLPTFSRNTSLYPHTSESFTSSRSVPVALYDRVKEIYNPLNIMSERDLGRTLGRLLITLYVQKTKPSAK